MLHFLDDIVSVRFGDGNIIPFHPPRHCNSGSNSLRRSIIAQHLPRVFVELSMEAKDDTPRRWRAQCVVIGS